METLIETDRSRIWLTPESGRTMGTPPTRSHLMNYAAFYLSEFIDRIGHDRKLDCEPTDGGVELHGAIAPL